MLERIKQITTAQWLFIGALVVGLFIVYNIVVAFTRIGEIKVSINVIPKDAKVSVDGKFFSQKTAYLGEGKHTFSASADGWETDTQKISISKDLHDVYLLPAPKSDVAIKWLQDNPAVQQQREAYGGINFARLNDQALKDNPVLSILPRDDPTGPYDIDYGPSPTKSGDFVITISYSTAGSRQKALTWLKQQGYDPTDFDIQYADYVNPLLGNGVNRD